MFNVDELIFHLEKDKAFKNARSFKYWTTKKYEKIQNIEKLYERIVNYQVKKYGQTLCSNNR